MNARVRGFSMVLIGAMLWGLSGTAAQKLFEDYGFTTGYLVTMRLLIAGSLLLGFAWIRGKRVALLGVWKDRRDRIGLIVFGLLGLLGAQYTYFIAIETGNAATATLLQYLAPLLVTMYVAVQARKMPRAIEMGAVLLALLGTALLVTNGRWDALSVPGIAVFWGVISAVPLAFNTLYPGGLLSRYGAEVIVGWGMLIGGLGLLFIERPWLSIGHVWTGMSLSLVLFVIFFGTLIAFLLYLGSLRYNTPTETSLLACLEPLVAVIASVVWLHVQFGIYQAIGGLCIMGTVAILSLPKKEDRSNR